MLDRFRTGRRQLALLLGLPLFAASLTAALILSLEPTRYEASATVALLSGSAPREVDQITADFAAALTSGEVLLQTSEETGVAPEVIAGGLDVDRLSGSGFVQVVHQSTDRTLPDKVVRPAAEAALELLRASRLGPYDDLVDTRRSELQSVEEELSKLLTEAGSVSLVDDYQQQSSELSTLRVTAQQLRAEGDVGTAAQLEADIQQRRDELAEMRPDVARFTSLTETRSAAVEALRSAEDRRATAMLQYQLQGTTSVVSGDAETTSVDALSDLVRRVGAAFAAGLLLAIGILLVPSTPSSTGLGVPTSTWRAPDGLGSPVPRDPSDSPSADESRTTRRSFHHA